MTDQTDLTIPISALQFDSDHIARASAMELDTTQVGALLQHVIQRHTTGLLEAGEPLAVSVTFDVSAPATRDQEIRFESRIDRRTRTLVFASGTAVQDGRHLLKATVVYRIV